jgi:NAD(P)-dependent dehydrogenase (short-subunit alcohol dehydrogenase family)
MMKTVFVTGAGSLVGLATAEALTRAGHRVFATMRDPFDRNRDAANMLWAQGIDVVHMDVTEDASVDEATGYARRKSGRLDVLVNAARTSATFSTLGGAPTEFGRILDVNVVGMFRVLRAVVPEMRGARSGLVINIGSILGRVGMPQLGLSSVAEAATEALTDVAQAEFAPFGVDVVLVRHGIHLDMTNRHHATAPAVSRPDGSVPSGGTSTGMLDVPDAAEIAATICSLVTQHSGYRASRMTVGNPYGTDMFDRRVEDLRRGVLEMTGRPNDRRTDTAPPRGRS